MQCYSSSSVPLSRLTGNWQVTTTICNNLWNFCTRARQFPNRNEAEKRQELKDSKSESVLGSYLVSLCSADCSNWCCDTLITQLMRLLVRTRTSFSINQTSQKRRQLFLRPPVAWHVSNSSEILAPNCNIYRTTRKQAVAVPNNPLKNPNIRSIRH